MSVSLTKYIDISRTSEPKQYTRPASTELEVAVKTYILSTTQIN